MAHYDDEDELDQQDDIHPKRELENGDETQDHEAPKKKITIHVSHQEQQISVAVSMSTQFSKVFDVAYKKFNKKKGTIKFTFDGQRVQADDTPKMLEMTDGDLIEAHIEQLGGHC